MKAKRPHTNQARGFSILSLPKARLLGVYERDLIADQRYRARLRADGETEATAEAKVRSFQKAREEERRSQATPFYTPPTYEPRTVSYNPTREKHRPLKVTMTPSDPIEPGVPTSEEWMAAFKGFKPEKSVRTVAWSNIYGLEKAS